MNSEKLPINEEIDHCFSGACMTSDFENDEITDSAFPVEFTDDGAPLDLYGVWVKNGPRDASIPAVSATEHAPDAGLPPLSTNENSPIDDFSVLPDLPDFTVGELAAAEEAAITDEAVVQQEAVVPEPAVRDSFGDFTIGEIRFEEIASESIGSDKNLPSMSEPEEPEYLSSRKEIDESDFNAVDASEFLDSIEISADSAEAVQIEPDHEEFVAEITDGMISFEEIRPDELCGKVECPKPVPDVPKKSAVARSEANPLNISGFEEVSIEFIDTMEAAPAPAEKIAEEEISAFEAADASESEMAELTDFSDIETTDQAEPEIIALAEPVSDVSPDDFGGITIPADDDFSSFLDDLNSGAASSQDRSISASENIELDSFIDSFNESGGVSHEDTAQLYDDIDPVDLELEFDEAFIEDSEKIRATGATVSESEFFNSEFGVELIDETFRDAAQSSVDDEFASLAESADLPSQPESEPPKPASYAETFESTSEFDDLLQSLDLAPAPAQAKTGQQPVRSAKPGSFDLVVTDEDDQGSIQASVMENTSSEDVDIPLFGTVPEIQAVQENLDIPVIRDYNDTESGHDTDQAVSSVLEERMAPDFDDISAVEQELNDLTPDTGDETVVTNDKSTELLMIIADELSSIKQELTTLKSELSTFKAAGLTAEPGVPPESAGSTENSGFFSDDDTDETIALTGDELNNILITADFTEEKSDNEESPSIEAASAEVAEEPVAEAAIADTGNFEETIEEEIPETLPDSFFEMPNLEAAAPIEVSHVTTIEDDVSYLEGSESVEPELDNVAIEEPDLETIDFDDEKLEEPELTEFNIDLSDIAVDMSAGQEVPVPESEEPISFEEPALSATDFAAVPDIALETGTPFDVSVSEEPVLEAAVAEVAPEVSDQTAVEENEPAPVATLPVDLKNEIKSVLSYMDQLLESLPEDKIEEFARSEHFEVYKKLFEELGIS
jgi:hypothetical protein